MVPDISRPLQSDDLDRLDHFLQSVTCGGEAVGVSFAHGFLTAVTCGPEAREPAEWLRLMFDEPVFDTGEEAKEMLGLAMRLHDDIDRSLRGESAFRPVFEYVRGREGSPQPDAQSWCNGFVAGFKLYGERWSSEARAELHAPLGLILSMAENPGVGDPLYAQLCDALPGAAELMYQYWRSAAQH